ncbi:dimethylaniline monooxygenase [Wickerhamomyces ciferrii]|uniref:Dimethylaniline monooxygenase n=1 Tax=Wickerhamomyces ciferrii (strain ATCC 14091 / BCRC 22168 / CBS 111 / JCM 3599 / NBRC 0793 / NRRL Y-1031 F-60-10) TaxID=1206466 RepID=K0KTI5_WICCF|nr:dimethylaniline monooxygenase [Wickerhamomyces ciferrii]CCH46481.1 dimethylaniline monooxygenase [Wickerhamomyces ciferrii]
MTITQPETQLLPSKISSVAVIGGGPAGLTSVYELLHTSKDGISTVGGGLPLEPAFTKIQGFEQLSQIGGVWNASLDKTDPPVPSSKTLKLERFNDPFVLKPRKPIPKDLVIGKEVIKPLEILHPQYSNSAVYEHLYTNIPEELMSFSYQQLPRLSESSIRPFLRHYEVLERLKLLESTYDLGKYYRFNTEVESVSYNPNSKSWTLVSRTINYGDQTETWRSEVFDAVIVAGGQNNIPYYPQIKGLQSFIQSYPNKLIHAKTYRSSEQLANKNVLIIGSSSTASNIISTGFPVAKSIYLSRRSPKHNFDYLNRVFASDGIIPKPEVEEFHQDGTIEFNDGSLLKDVDLIIIATGYLYHAPYLQEGLLDLNNPIESPIYSKKADNLYLHAFNIKLPTLAFVGIPNTPTVWRAIETTASAVAGIWSGSKRLPPLEDQLKWRLERIEESTNDKRFQQYPTDSAKEKLIDPLFELAPKGRTNPLPDDQYKQVINKSFGDSERLFYEFKNGVLKDK